MLNKYFNTLIVLFFVLLSNSLVGQININQYQKQFGKGETTLKKKIVISFFYNELDKVYNAKVSHFYEKLYIGEDYAKGLVQVPFNNFQDVKLQKARYFKLDTTGNKILIENVKVKYADIKDYFVQNIFYTDLKVKQFNCSVDLPKNYLINYKYDVIYKDLKFLSSFYFQDINEGVEKVEILIKKNVNIDFSTFDLNCKEIEKTEDDTYIRFKGKNLKRFIPTKHSVSSSYYLPHIILSVKQSETIEKVIEILKSSDNIYSWYNSLIKELKPDQEYIDELSRTITKSSVDDEEKIENIFKWVQNNIQYIAFEDGIAGFKPSEADKVATLKYGDCKGMANLLVSLLKSQGFDARHAWIGTRNNNYSYNIPSLVVDNHMICGLNYNNKMYYLDGTSKSAVWTIPPAHLEGKEVMVANNETYDINTIKKSNPKQNTININGIININENQQPTITLDVELKGHFKRDFISYKKYSSMKDELNIPFYFIYNYLTGIKVENITEPLITDDKITYTVSGNYINIAKGAQTTIFPFLDIFKYENITKTAPPIYINYPQEINVTLEIKNKEKKPTKNYPKILIVGNDNFNANYYTEMIGEKYYVRQHLNLNILHSPLIDNQIWSDFASQLNAFNNYPLTYE